MTRRHFGKLTKASGLAMGLSMAAWSGAAQATAFTAQQILSTFNLVTSGNVSSQSDIEGSAVIGGSLTNQNAVNFFNNSTDVPAKPSIYLYGGLSGGNVNIDSSKAVLYYTGMPTGVNFNGSSQVKSLPDALTDYTTPLRQLSTQLGALAATTGTTISNGNFNAGSATGLVVFNIAASYLNNLQNGAISFTGGAGVTGYIVNVTGTTVTETSSTNFNNVYSNAIFNFTNATGVTLGNWNASVLAPAATLTISNGYIDGSVFAANFAGGGELHNDNLYRGALPATATVPEVSTWAMMLAGFAMVGFALRTRRETTVMLSFARI